MFDKTVNGILMIEGMTCGHCQQRVTDALSGVKGVKKVVVNLDKKSAEVTFLEKKTNLEKLKEIIEEAGYTVANLHMV